ncbi:MAG: hypothetical protein HY204_03980 [Nitrospirae bacterium]|nr:hypothetical protein [Nitrospirota bacterium]
MDSVLVIFAILIPVAVLLCVLMSSIYRVVPVDSVDVVVGRTKTRIYSGDPSYSQNGRAAYFLIPAWVPWIGVRVHRLSLNMMEFSLEKSLTYDRNRVRFETDIVAYAIIEGPIKAAARFPEGRDVLMEHVRKIMKASNRDTTTKMTLREIINEREMVAKKLFETIQPEISKWGLKLHAVELVSIRDPSEGSSTAIKDISSMAEVQIHAEARQRNAEQFKQARLKEAEAEEAAKIREIERDKEINIREQLKLQEVTREQQRAREEELKVVRIEQVTKAEIERDAMIQRAEGEKESIIRVKSSEAEGIRLVGEAEAEAKSKLADALKKINESSLDVRRIEKDERIGLAAADALKNAQIKLIHAGAPTSLLDLLSPAGGAHLGGMLAALQASDPEMHEKLVKVLEKGSSGHKVSGK